MNPKTARFRFLVLLLVVSMAIGSLTVTAQIEPAKFAGSSSAGVRTVSFAPVSQSLPYDEQVGETFGQNFTSLIFNVTATTQEDPTTGIGPAYLLNGLTDSGYWYQVGLSYRWPKSNGAPFPGFNMSYEVFMPQSLCGPFGCTCQGSIFPTNCQIGTDNLKVNPGDIVGLSLSIVDGNVTMRTRDWNTMSTVSENFTSEGGTKFMGSPLAIANSDGFFTGLMTEQYFSTAYYGTGTPVTYRQTGYNISSAMMWMDEFNVYSFQQVFSDQTQSSISFNNTSLLQYFTSHGTAEAANGNELVTGLTPVTFASLASSITSTYRPGQQADIAVGIDNPSGLTIRITSLSISTQFGTFDVTSSVPSELLGNSTFKTNIPLPTTLSNGTYLVTISAQIQFRDPQISDWFAGQPISSNSLLTVSGHPVTPSNPTNLPTLFDVITTFGDVLLPTILALIAAGITAAATISIVTRREGTQAGPTLIASACRVCGGILGPNMLYCPSCGNLLGLSSLPDAATNQQPGQTPN